MVLETIRFIASKHPIAFKNQSILYNHSISPILQKSFASKQGLSRVEPKTSATFAGFLRTILKSVGYVILMAGYQAKYLPKI